MAARPEDLDTFPTLGTAARRPLREAGDSYLAEVVTDPALALLGTGLRVLTLGIAVILVVLGAAPGGRGALVAGVLLLANALARTLVPIRFASGRRAALELAAELVVTLVAVITSGATDSAFVLTPTAPLVLAGLGGGYAAAFLTAGGIVTAMGAGELVRDSVDSELRSGLLLGLLFVTIGVACGFTRGLALEVRERQERLRGEVTRLTEVNELLRALHARTRALPESLDLTDVLASTRSHLHRAVDFTALTIAVVDETGTDWRVELNEGARLPGRLGAETIPAAARAAVESLEIVREGNLLADGTGGFAASARSGVYVPLHARGRVVGVVAVEDTDVDHYGPDHVRTLAAFATPLALAVDNALVFARLRTLAAEAERARIARELHDHLAQSLAYVAFELERLASDRGDRQLDDLREIVRGLVGELRDALTGLRLKVTDAEPFSAVAESYVPAWADRAGLELDLRLEPGARRLPLPVEQELWRICQEALTNVERHSAARRCHVAYWIGSGRARLEVSDDGRGFRPEAVPGGRFGIVGMRERADAVGASFRIRSTPGRGTCVSVDVEVPT